MKMFIPLTKVDAVKREVYGVATQEVRDRTGEVMDYNSSKPEFQRWSREVYENSNGQSLGNVRAMHSNIAVGKLTKLDFNDEDRAVEVCAKIVDDNEWEKVEQGVYTGFSVGGGYGKTWFDPQGFKRYTALPSEISLVDMPCVQTATFQLVKMDGSVELKKFKEGTAVKLDSVVQAAFQKAIKSGDLQKAFSFEEIKNRLRGALNGEIKTPFDCGYFYIRETFADKVIIEGDLDGDGDEDLLAVDYTMDEAGVITLGSIQAVKTGDYVPATDEDNPSTLNGLPLKKRGAPLAKKDEAVVAEDKPADEVEKCGKMEKANAYDDYKRRGGSDLDEGRGQEDFLTEDDLDTEIDDEIDSYGKMKKDFSDKGKVDPVAAPDMAEKLVKGVSNSARKASDNAITKSDKAETIDDHSKAADAHREAASKWDEVSKATPDGSTTKHFADNHKEFHEKAADHHDSMAKTAPVEELKKSLAKGGKFELSKLSELHHAIGEFGGACKCDKCSGLYKGDEVPDGKPEIVTSPAESKEKVEQLQKLAGSVESLQKGFDALQAENTELKAQLKKMEDSPVPGGPILNTGILEKMIGGAVANGSPEKGPNEQELQKAFDYLMEAANPEQKQTVSVLRSQAAMKAALTTPINY